jgi:hypothetical protein
MNGVFCVLNRLLIQLNFLKEFLNLGLFHSRFSFVVLVVQFVFSVYKGLINQKHLSYLFVDHIFWLLLSLQRGALHLAVTVI